MKREKESKNVTEKSKCIPFVHGMRVYVCARLTDLQWVQREIFFYSFESEIKIMKWKLKKIMLAADIVSNVQTEAERIFFSLSL